MPKRTPTSDDDLKRAYSAVAAHKSIRKAAHLLGLGMDGCRKRYARAVRKFNLPPVDFPAAGSVPAELNPERDSQLHSARADALRYRKAYVEIVKGRAEEERLLDMFAKSIQTLPAIPANHFKSRLPQFQRSPQKSQSTETPVLLRSDQQIGEIVSPNETRGVNAYNFDIFQARLEQLEMSTLDILSDHQRAYMPRLVVPYLGDNISGRIHDELQKFGHQHVIDQVYIGAAAEALFLYRMLKYGRWSEIIVPCLSGNHGRLDKMKESKQYYKNFDYLFANIMATFLRNVPQIKFEIPQALFTLLDIEGHRVLLSHGHELPPSSLGIPLYSINRASAGYQELLSMSNETRFEYWFMGHFHRPLELDGSFVNGTMVGLSEFGIGRFKPIRPMQRLFGFHTKYGRAWEYPIQLDKGISVSERRAYLFDADGNPVHVLDQFAEATKDADKAA